MDSGASQGLSPIMHIWKHFEEKIEHQDWVERRESWRENKKRAQHRGLLTWLSLPFSDVSLCFRAYCTLLRFRCSFVPDPTTVLTGCWLSDERSPEKKINQIKSPNKLRCFGVNVVFVCMMVVTDIILIHTLILIHTHTHTHTHNTHTHAHTTNIIHITQNHIPRTSHAHHTHITHTTHTHTTHTHTQHVQHTHTTQHTYLEGKATHWEQWEGKEGETRRRRRQEEQCKINKRGRKKTWQTLDEGEEECVCVCVCVWGYLMSCVSGCACMWVSVCVCA